MHIGIIEDESFRNFLPLTYLRPVFDLRCGALTLREKILAHLPADSLTLHVRPALLDLVREENPSVALSFNRSETPEQLLVNGCCIMNRAGARKITKTKGDAVFVSGGHVVATKLSGQNLEKAIAVIGADPSAQTCDSLAGALGDSVPRVEIDIPLASYPWDLLYSLETEITNDIVFLAGMKKSSKKGKAIHRSAVLIGRKNVFIGKKTEVGPGVVLDASEGPVYIGQGVEIKPHAFIAGPVTIGDGSVVKAGARIAHAAIGPVCKVAGEIEHSIFQSHSNKAHDGYVGHSFIGSWVNLGAGTTTSNLKNTYGNVKVTIDGKSVDSGRMFLGLTAGDHVKTGINATLDTGTVIGVSSNIFGTGLPPKSIPSFAWGMAGQLGTYDCERAVDVAQKVMARRSVVCTDTYKALLRAAHQTTEHERA
jgi:UDP-N-acetylglucosamine diphosphorylase/glucosamine-1-phosphate N-acetyltransferase